VQITYIIYFFFQAEDGIRDRNVTGVQTCALPIFPVQILWVNLVTDGFPALALGLDTPKENAMKEKPRSPKEGIFARGLGFKILSRGLLIGIVSLAAFMIS